MFRPISWRKQAEKAARRTRYCELSEFSFSTARITTETKAGVISAAPHARYIATMPTSGKKHPQWVLLVHSSGILAFRLVAFAPFQGARLSAPESAAMSLTNFRFIATMPTSGKKHPQWVLLVHSSGIEPESAAPEATVLSIILRVRNFLTYILYFIRARVSNDYGKSKREN